MPRRKKKIQCIKCETEEVERVIDEDELLLGSGQTACQVKTSPLVGRYLVARKRLKAGETILVDDALVVGPCQNTKLVCIGCCTLLDLDIKFCHRCKGCGWPVCGGGCSGLNGTGPSRHSHTVRECKLLQTFSTPPHAITSDDPSRKADIVSLCFNMVTPLRCLMLREQEPETWQKIIRMESHNETRRQIPNIWMRNEFTVVQPIRRIAPQFSEELIHTICGILEVNCFSVGLEGVDSRALYPRAYLFQHDCTPNTTHMDVDNFTMIIKSSVEIRPGTPITLSYTSTLNGTLRRREELKKSKFFDCCCPRCSCNSELGTYMSAVKCWLCQNGWCLPVDPLVPESKWKCDNCEAFVPFKRPVTITEQSSDDLESITGDPKIKDYEKLLSKYENFLHPNHSTMVKIKYTLSQMYGKAKGCLINNMTEKMLKKKYDICIELLEVFDVIEPGLTRIRGITLYECHAPLLMLAQIGYMNGKLNKREVKKDLNRVKKMLAESVVILKLERPESAEGQIYQAALEALEHPGLCFA